MKYVTVLYLFIFATLTRLQAQEGSDLLQKVKARLDRVNDYVAKGKMKIDVSFIDAPQSRVDVYYRKPDQFKIKKEGGISILPKGGVNVNMGTLLAGNDYDIVPGKDSRVDGTDTRVLKLLPRNENSDVVLTTLYVDDKNLVIRKATVTTRENGTYDLQMRYGRYLEWGLPDQVLFSFNVKEYKIPKGITFEYDKGGPGKAPPKGRKGSVEISYTSYVINKGVDDKVFK